MTDIVSPIDDRVAYTFRELDQTEIDRTIERAARAQADFARVPLEARIALCEQMLVRYAERLDENAEQITRMMGKPIRQARNEFSGSFRERTRALFAIAGPALADVELPAPEPFKKRIRKEPVGVVLIIAPWNYPLLTVANVLIPALLAGNAVLVKHAAQTSLVAGQLERAFREAGAPEGLVSALPVGHEACKRAIANEAIGFVAFTGSVGGGRAIYRAVAEQRFIGVGLELGGKDPALVLPDAPFDETVENLVDGAFYNTGQSCCGIERIYVHEDAYDRFVDAYVARVERYVVGDPLDPATEIGPLVNAAAADFVRDQVKEAVAQGARQLVDERRFQVPSTSRAFMAPQVVVDANDRARVMYEESFGPVVGIARVAGDHEAIRRMNDSPYGLTASIWTSDLERAERIGERLQTGTVFMNRCDYVDPALAWTGVKDSGFGVSLSALGFGGVTRPKSYHLRTRF